MPTAPWTMQQETEIRRLNQAYAGLRASLNDLTAKHTRETNALKNLIQALTDRVTALEP